MVKAKSHLLKHEVPENVDSVFHFGTDDKKEIARLVAAMGQRQLQVSPPEGFHILVDIGTFRAAEKGASVGKGARQGGVQPVLTEAIWWPDCCLWRAGKIQAGVPDEHRLQ